MRGPIADPDRSQPANLLWNNDRKILVDAGDGAAGQLAKIDVPLADINTLILTHLHVDHTGGLAAIIGMRFQQRLPGELTIYGPPGTRQLVDGIRASQQPLKQLTEAGGSDSTDDLPTGEVRAVEIEDGSSFSVGDVAVTVSANSHYPFDRGSEDARKHRSLSLRFDTPDRSIAVTGDTGPSDAVRELAEDADLLVAEVTDPAREVAELRAQRPDIPAVAVPLLERHFSRQHLTAAAVGKLASDADVGALVLTHNPLPDELLPQAEVGIAKQYDGPVAFAEDLDNY